MSRKRFRRMNAGLLRDSVALVSLSYKDRANVPLCMFGSKCQWVEKELCILPTGLVYRVQLNIEIGRLKVGIHIEASRIQRLQILGVQAKKPSYLDGYATVSQGLFCLCF